MVLDVIQVTQNVPTEDVNSLLGWAVGLLAGLVATLLVLVKTQYDNRIKDLRQEHQNLRLELKAEQDYNKAQDNANIKLISDTGNILASVLKHSENNADIWAEVKPILNQMNGRLEDIHKHQTKGP